ncbi:hypothetical protein ACX818_001347 [Acinetobacter baumannii]
MTFILDKTIVIHKDPKSKAAIFRIVDAYPCRLKFEFEAKCRYGKVGNIDVTNLDNGKKIKIKPHQCECLEVIDYEVLR